MVISTRTVRVARELMKLNSVIEKEEGFNIVMNNNNNVEDINTPFEVQFKGPDGSPYDKMLLSLQISFPISYLFFVLMFRFPFEPPLINFISPIYHPNIDSDGRICLDILKLPPKGCWRPTCSLLHLLHSIKILLLEPNPDDPLAQEYLFNRTLYNLKASHNEYSTISGNTIAMDEDKGPSLNKKRSSSKLLGLLSKRPKL